MAHFVTDSLDRDLSAGEYAEFVRRRRAGEFGPSDTPWSGIVVVVAFVIIMAVITCSTMHGGRGGRGWHGWIFPMIWGAVAVGVIVRGALRWRASGRTWRSWAKLARFASENGLKFRLRSHDPNYPGLLFGVGDSRAPTEHVCAPSGVLADAGAYTYRTGTSKNRQTHHCNFLAFRLPKSMPHMLLDARANNLVDSRQTNLPASFRAEQRLELGAPFDQHFVLYAPRDYAEDAFYLFPPDLMKLLLDVPPKFDIEIVDDWMFFYTQSALDLHRSETWQMVERIENTAGARLGELSRRYTDRRVSASSASEPLTSQASSDYGPGRIATRGQRLRHGVSWSSVLLLVMTLLGLAALFTVDHWGGWFD